MSLTADMLRPLPDCGQLLGQPQDLRDLSVLHTSWRALYSSTYCLVKAEVGNIFSLAPIFPGAVPMVKLEEVNVSNITAHPFNIWFVMNLKDLVYWRDF